MSALGPGRLRSLAAGMLTSLLVGLVGLLVAPRARAEVPLVQLAELFAREIERTAAGRSVEVSRPEDRTGRGATLAADFADLLLTRLEGRVPLHHETPELTIAPTLSEDSRRLRVSARVVRQPEGRLVDLLSVSVEKDPTRLAPSSIPSPPTRGGFEVISADRTPPVPEPILDLAFVDEAHLLAVFPDSVALLRRQAGDVVVASRLALPGPSLPVRAPGAIVLPAARPEEFWVMTSRSSRAVRVRAQDGGLLEVDSALALPFPGSADGLRYQVGTNLLEGLPPRFGPGPHLGLDGVHAVSATGELVDSAVPPSASPSKIRSGPALARLWPGLLAAASASPPATHDTIQLVVVDAGPARVVESVPIDGAVRALSAQVLVPGERALLAAAVELEGDHHLVFMTVAGIRTDVPPLGTTRP